MGSAGSEGFLILGGFFGPLVPCLYYLSLRASLGGRVLGLSLTVPLGLLIIGGIICSFPCSIPWYATYPLGTILYRGASSILF